MQISIRVDSAEALANIRGIADEQIPFAMKTSLNETVKLGQKAVQEALPLRFTIRRLAWAKQGVKVTTWATKQNLQAILEDIHQYMELQDEGGVKVPQYGQYLAIPLSGARKNVRAIVAAEDMPANVMRNRGGFIRGNVMYLPVLARSKSRRGFKGVKGFSQGSWSRQIVPMYALVRRATIKPAYGFTQLVREQVDAHWEEEFGKAFQKAVATRR